MKRLRAALREPWFWKIGGSVTLAAIVLSLDHMGAPLGVREQERAPLLALSAVVAYSISLIPTGSGENDVWANLSTRMIVILLLLQSSLRGLDSVEGSMSLATSLIGVTLSLSVVVILGLAADRVGEEIRRGRRG